MTFIHCVSVAVLFVLGLASPALATIAAIETRTPLSDHSEQGIRSAIEEAVKSSAKAAAAMGLPRLALDKALVLKDSIIVRVLASDEGGGSDEDASVTEPNKPESSKPESGKPESGKSESRKPGVSKPTPALRRNTI